MLERMCVQNFLNKAQKQFSVKISNYMVFCWLL